MIHGIGGPIKWGHARPEGGNSSIASRMDHPVVQQWIRSGKVSVCRLKLSGSLQRGVD